MIFGNFGYTRVPDAFEFGYPGILKLLWYPFPNAHRMHIANTPIILIAWFHMYFALAHRPYIYVAKEKQKQKVHFMCTYLILWLGRYLNELHKSIIP